MIKTYKFIHSDESKVYLTSDTHFSHTKLVEQRGFKSIEEHDETLIKNWNDLVRPQDTVIHCGHGPATTIGAEKRSNYILQELAV